MLSHRKNIMGTKYVNAPIKVEEALDHLRLDGIALPSPHEVHGYLLRHPNIMEILLPVCETARDEFSANTHLSLEVYHDPEIRDEYLTLYVRQENYDQDFMDRIDKISASFEAELAEKTGWLLVTTDFRHPSQK